jgi:hypothetical protein
MVIGCPEFIQRLRSRETWLRSARQNKNPLTVVSAAGLKLQPDSGLSILLTDSKTMSSATKVVAASSAMLPLVTAQTVASERGVGGRISR